MAGFWRWRARFPGNAWHRAAATACSDLAQQVRVDVVVFADGFEPQP